MVLEADAALPVAQREQEVVVVVVMRAEERVRLLDQGAVCRERVRRGLDPIGTVAEHVEPHRDGATGIEIVPLDVAAPVDRRIHQRVERDRLERRRRAAGRRGFQRRRDLPAVRRPERRLDGDVAREVAGRVQHRRTPLEIEHLGRHRDPADPRRHGREPLEVGVDGGDAGRHDEVKRVDIDPVAGPREATAACVQGQSGELVDRPGRRVMAGNPLRIQQDHRARVGDRDGLVHGEHPMARVRRVDGQADRAGIGPIPGRGNGWRQRHRLRSRGRCLAVQDGPDGDSDDEGETLHASSCIAPSIARPALTVSAATGPRSRGGAARPRSVVSAGRARAASVTAACRTR